MKKHIGFSLLELMMVLAIMSVLIGVIYPHYQSTLVRARRLDGQVALFELAKHMEHAYALEHTYLFTQNNHNTLPTQSAAGHYQLSISERTDDTFTLQATPNNTQKDLACESLTLNSQGKKGVVNGPWGAPSHDEAYCWQ